MVVVAVGAGVEVDASLGERPCTARPGCGRGCGASAGSRGRPPAIASAVGKWWVTAVPSVRVTGLPYAADEPGRDRAGAGDRDLLADHRPHRHLGAVDRARDPHARPGGDQRREQRVGREDLVDRGRVGVEVEQPPDAGDRGHHVARVGQRQLAARRGHRPRAARRWPRRAAAAAPGGRSWRRPPRPRAPPWCARRRISPAPSKGGRTGRRSDRCTGCRRRRLPCAGGRRARSSRGVVANTARTVSLNCRMLAKPAANATSAKGIAVVSISTRAVWARWARARDCAPAPTSASQQPVQLALAVAEPGGQAADAVAVDGAVGDQPHRARRRCRSGRSTPASRVRRRAGSACRPGSRPAGRPRRSGRT